MTDYKNRYFDKIDESLKRIEERQSKHDEKLDKIHDQVKKTNGRVTTIEEWKSTIEAWRKSFTGSSQLSLNNKLVWIVAIIILLLVATVAGSDIITSVGEIIK